MAKNVYVIKKRKDTNGNPIYVLLIPGENERLPFLRKLKADNQYSVQSYNLRSTLKRALGENVNIEESY